MQQQFLYVLELEQGKFYVGKSSNVEERFIEHIDGLGSEFTKLYKAVRIVDKREYDDFDEDKFVKKYMMCYGIENVRGGVYSQVKLMDDDVNRLKREMWHEKGLCLKCGSGEHWVKDCIVENEIVKEENGVEENKMEKKKVVNKACFRCGRVGHWVSNCYARSDVNGNDIGDKKWVGRKYY